MREIHDEVDGIELEIVMRSDSVNGKAWVKEGEKPPVKTSGFQVIPKRWIVERTFAWFSLNRRLSKDYEAKPKVSEAWLWIAMTSILVKRLAR